MGGVGIIEGLRAVFLFVLGIWMYWESEAFGVCFWDLVPCQ